MGLLLNKVGQSPLRQALPLLTKDVQGFLPRVGRVFGVASKPEKSLANLLKTVRPGPEDMDAFANARLFLRKSLPEQTARDRILAAIFGGGAGLGGLGTFLATRGRVPLYSDPFGAVAAPSPTKFAQVQNVGLKRRASTPKKRTRRTAKFRWQDAELHKRDTTPSEPFHPSMLPVARPKGAQ